MSAILGAQDPNYPLWVNDAWRDISNPMAMVVTRLQEIYEGIDLSERSDLILAAFNDLINEAILNGALQAGASQNGV